MIVANIFLAVWDSALKILVLMGLALRRVKVRREAELLRSTSWPVESGVRCSKCFIVFEGCRTTLQICHCLATRPTGVQLRQLLLSIAPCGLLLALLLPSSHLIVPAWSRLLIFCLGSSLRCCP